MRFECLFWRLLETAQNGLKLLASLNKANTSAVKSSKRHRELPHDIAAGPKCLRAQVYVWR